MQPRRPLSAFHQLEPTRNGALCRQTFKDKQRRSCCQRMASRVTGRPSIAGATIILCAAGISLLCSSTSKWPRISAPFAAIPCMRGHSIIKGNETVLERLSVNGHNRQGLPFLSRLDSTRPRRVGAGNPLEPGPVASVKNGADRAVRGCGPAAECRNRMFGWGVGLIGPGITDGEAILSAPSNSSIR